MSGISARTFEAYVDSLEDRISQAQLIPGLRRRDSVLKSSLDGEVGREFRIRVSLAARRAAGAFFTGPTLARQLSRYVLTNLPPNAVVADPACGIGDLLLSIARKLPTGRRLDDTLDMWGTRLAGTDINPQFVRVTKIRLLALAMAKSQVVEGTPPAPSSLFPLISVGDFLSSPEKLTEASHVLVNPPYHDMLAPLACTWGHGKVSAAAVFIDRCMSNIKDGVGLSAILPDVLRSGSYYDKWRKYVAGFCRDLEISTYGQFDSFTDVDVFILHLKKGRKAEESRVVWWRSLRTTHAGKVADFFDVHVGPVVPHRHRKKGPSVAYVHARTLPAWGTKKRINEKRKFNGTLFGPPFVVVRRTSRPGEKRAIGTIVTGKRKVAIENHVLVLLPRKGTVRECVRLLRILRTPQTDEWLNRRIRCRHLTVGAVRALPWWSC